MPKRTVTYGQNFKELNTVFLSLLAVGVVGLATLTFSKIVVKGIITPDEVMP
jgi:hypothetical protein